MSFNDNRPEKLCDKNQSKMNSMNDLSIIKQEQQRQQSMKTAITTITTTTGGKNIATGSMSHQNACVKEATIPIPTTTQSSSSSSSTTTTKRQKTLSFLHNEDLFDLNEGMNSGPGQSPILFRSVSFQDRKLQMQHLHGSTSTASIKRAESAKETAGESPTRKIAIVSSKSLYNEVNENFNKQHAQIQQQILQQMQNFPSAFHHTSEGFM